MSEAIEDAGQAARESVLIHHSSLVGGRGTLTVGPEDLTFPSDTQSQRFDPAWDPVASTFRTYVSPAGNVFAFKRVA